MNYVFVGPQGSGKGTQASILSQKLKIPHISSGDLLRGATGELKKLADSLIHSGKMVPNDIMIKIIQERISRDDCQNGFILDGFPRNLEQAKELDKITKINNVFNITLSDETAIQRLSSRLTCKSCNAIFNTLTIIPKVVGKCDKCGGDLIQRADDNQEAIKYRLKTYYDETKPMLKGYSTIPVNGEQSIEKVNEDIMKAMKFLEFFK
jgi:adenylate kinase